MAATVLVLSCSAPVDCFVGLPDRAARGQMDSRGEVGWRGLCETAGNSHGVEDGEATGLHFCMGQRVSGRPENISFPRLSRGVTKRPGASKIDGVSLAECGFSLASVLNKQALTSLFGLTKTGTDTKALACDFLPQPWAAAGEDLRSNVTQAAAPCPVTVSLSA